MKPRSVINPDLLADEHHRKKIDSLGDPLAEIESHIDFVAQAGAGKLQDDDESRLLQPEAASVFAERRILHMHEKKGII